MRLLPIMLLFASVCWTPAVLAENRLLLPENLQVVAANGENTSIAGRVQLPDGRNQIAIQFTADIGRSMGTERVSSDVFVLLFESDKALLILRMLQINNKYHLEKFNEHPDIRIFNGNNEALPLKIDKLEKEGFQLFRNYSQELAAYNQTAGPAALSSVHLETQPAPHNAESQPKAPSRSKVTNGAIQAASSALETSDNNESMALKMLKYWYQQADRTARERFEAWIDQ